jgi:hypothetical protein
MESIGVLRFNRHLNPNIAQKHAENCGKATISNSTVYKMQALRIIDHETEAVPRRRPLFDLLGDGRKTLALRRRVRLDRFRPKGSRAIKERVTDLNRTI